MFRFGEYSLDVVRGCLRAADREISLRPKSFEVLRYLVENAGRLIAKQELYEAVWADVVVSDDSIVQCIRELRCKLGDDDPPDQDCVSPRLFARRCCFGGSEGMPVGRLAGHEFRRTTDRDQDNAANRGGSVWKTPRVARNRSGCPLGCGMLADLRVRAADFGPRRP